jgi:REP element-mobilizing transposase RayT
MLAAHVIFGAYGFWLPNDPRGSWSDFVGAWNLYRYAGTATKTTETRSLAARPHDQARRTGAKLLLKRPPVKFTGIQARAIGRGFATYGATAHLSILACAILPDHVHLVLAQHRLPPKQLTIQLKGAATQSLLQEGIHPFGNTRRPPKCFARGEWIVYLDTDDDVHRAIAYVEANPEKEGLPHQHWSFVTPCPRR